MKAAAINATSQVSRFHVDTLTTLSKEIDLKDVTVSVGDHDLVQGSHLKLKEGVHYSLIGRNGVGKTTLLKTIAEKLIPGIPLNLRILLVDQVESNTSSIKQDLETRTGITVTQKVVESDSRRQAAIEEQQVLNKAFESSAINDLATALASVKLGRANVELAVAQNLASRRSGARGADARKELLKAEALVAECEEVVEQVAEGQYSADVANEAAVVLEEVQTTLEDLDASATEANARSILTGLGFSQTQLDAPFTSLSGGWRSRCSLASALLQKPDLLLLDEPTNFLDLQSIIWLQSYISTFPSTVLVVAHDRAFVDNISDEVVILRKQKLSYFEGNLTDYERNFKKVRKSKMRMQDALDKKKQAVEKTIEEGRRSAKKTGDDGRAKMAKSRQKKLDERWGLERSDKGTRFKLNRDLGGYHLTNRAVIEIEDLDPPIKMVIPDPEPLRFPGFLLSATNITFKYRGMADNLIDDFSLTMHPGARVALVGLNGNGKSTLVKILIGSLKPNKGKVETHSRMKMAYYAQHSVEELSSTAAVNLSSLEYFKKKLEEDELIEADEGDIRGFLSGFGLQGKKATIPIGMLSGGQKVRLALALVVYPAPDLLVLDEVSTHLDLDTIAALVRALRRFTGGILLVSHDRHLTKCVIEGAPLLEPSERASDDGEDSDSEDGEDEGRPPGTVYMVGMKGKIKVLPKGTDQYVELIEKRMRKNGLL